MLAASLANIVVAIHVDDAFTGGSMPFALGSIGVRACLLGSLIVGILGFALNDSGVAIPAMMFGIVLPWVTWLLLRTEASP